MAKDVIMRSQAASAGGTGRVAVVKAFDTCPGKRGT